MIDISTISIIVGVFTGLGVLLAGCGFAYAQFKRGGSEADTKTIASQKEYITQLEDRNQRLSEEKSGLIKSHGELIAQLNKDLSELRGRFDEQSKRANEYKELLQGRDPEMVGLLREVKALLTTLSASRAGL